ncbi:MAG: hypothetical protein ACR2RF_12970 [Geminicoccaceae bacterium]
MTDTNLTEENARPKARLAETEAALADGYRGSEAAGKHCQRAAPGEVQAEVREARSGASHLVPARNIGNTYVRHQAFRCNPSPFCLTPIPPTRTTLENLDLASKAFR